MIWKCRRWRMGVALAALMAVCAQPARAQTVENVLVVANSASPASNEIADYYVRARRIPGDQVLRLTLPLTEEITRTVFQSDIQRPLSDWLTSHAAQDRILYIVLIKGVPLRVAGTTGPNGSVASVDSELTLLYRRLTGAQVAIAGSLRNPYFAGDAPLADAKPFTHRAQDIYLVARLDGYTVADVKGLIDRAATPAQEGRILLDGRLELSQSVGNKWLINAAATLKKMPGWADNVILDTSLRALSEKSDVLGYYTWGSNDRTATARHPDIHFAPGALAGEYVSTDARTFDEPPADWLLNSKPFRGSHQSLIGDLIRDGITGIAGHVAEPYINATIRPDVLFPAYLSGFNLIESFYLAMPSVSWQTLVIGDPLCAPFRTKTVAAGDLDPGAEPSTELPRFLSDRRIATLKEAGVKTEAAKLFAKAEVRHSKDDLAGARTALEQAIAADDSFVDAHLQLAALHGRLGEWDAAIDQFRRVVAKSPSHPVALNDLAYTLATRKKALDEALTFAKRAYTVPNASPEAVDTLAWVYHLLGQEAEAEPLITTAVGRLPLNAEVRLHAAVIHAATGNLDGASRELDSAVKMESALADRDEAKELRQRLGAAAK